MIGFRNGIGATCYGQTASVWGDPGAVWDYILHGCPTPIATPGAPTGAVLTVPPASEADAQATVDALLNQQLRDQQALNAAGVQSSSIDSISSAAVAAGDTISNGPGGVSWLVWGAIGIGIFGFVALSAGSPRRYGR